MVGTNKRAEYLSDSSHFTATQCAGDGPLSATGVARSLLRILQNRQQSLPVFSKLIEITSNVYKSLHVCIYNTIHTRRHRYSINFGKKLIVSCYHHLNSVVPVCHALNCIIVMCC